MVNRSQMMAVWHVNDLKVLHKNNLNITRLTSYLCGIYGKMLVLEEERHNFLGMTLNYSKKGTLTVVPRGSEGERSNTSRGPFIQGERGTSGSWLRIRQRSSIIPPSS